MSIETININEIPACDYEGYLWYSNANEPELFNRRKISENDLKQLPFVVEGLLYCPDENVSIRITNIDGEYRISKMNVAGISSSQTTSFQLNTDKFGEGKFIHIYQHYENLPDPVNEGWEVAQPTWFAFVGFKK